MKTNGKPIVVIVLLATALGLWFFKSGRGHVFGQAVNGTQVVNR